MKNNNKQNMMERRYSADIVPPYNTDEGLIRIDRRTKKDRRSVARRGIPAAMLRFR